MVRLKLTLTLLLVLIFSTKGYSFPDSLLFKSYAIERQGLSQLFRQLDHVNNTDAIQRIGELEQWAESKGDMQLKLAYKLFKYEFQNIKNVEENTFEAEVTELINSTHKYKFEHINAAALEVMARHYWRTKNYSSALEYKINSYNVYSKFPASNFPEKSLLLYDFAYKYYHFRDFATARHYLLELWHDIPYDKIDRPHNMLNTLALCYMKLEQYDSANYYYHKAMDAAVQVKDTSWIGILNGNIGYSLYIQNKLPESIDYFERGASISLKTGELVDAANDLGSLCDVYERTNQKKRAFELAQQVYGIISSKHLWNIYLFASEIAPLLARVYAENGEVPLAYYILDSGRIAKDSSERQKNTRYLAGVQHKVEVDRHMAEMQAKEEDLSRQKTYRNIYVGGFSLLLLFSVVALQQNKKIGKEKLRSENLLLNILPPETAEELRATGAAKAKKYENVTVLFTDFKNFTEVSEKLSAEELVNEIHYCYSQFDKIIAKYDIEKIKTIGDSYMCAAGLPVINKTHTEDMIMAAGEMMKFIEAEKNQREKEGKIYFEMRIGIHSGPVVAGIVGIKKFAYDIWGDTVNMASRMESTGEEGKINISETTYQLIKERFMCLYRGEVEVKNRGAMKMYFVNEKSFLVKDHLLIKKEGTTGLTA